jgi:glycosyltransferase involved in cell wall biosynthesis
MSTSSVARRIAVPPAKLVARGLVGARTARWPDHSRLFAIGDGGGWSVEEDARHVTEAASRLGIAVGPAGWARFATGQSVFLTSHFEALTDRWLGSTHRLATAYMHGRPGTPGAPEFDDAFDALRGSPDRISRVQVTHAEMRDLVHSAGVAPERVFTIRLGIDIEHFPLVDDVRRRAARSALGLATTAFVAGSFQKDGVGWGEGLEPKLVKGPDVLLAAVERLREAVPELHVLLTGPARGYVRQGLDDLGVPYRHVSARSRDELAQAYHALDVYLVSSRQEGGPKAVLESMAAGIPLVSTRVGQAQEIVRHGVDGWLVDVEDAEGLARIAATVRDGAPEGMREAGRETAEAHALPLLDTPWAELLDGFVARGAA